MSTIINCSDTLATELAQHLGIGAEFVKATPAERPSTADDKVSCLELAVTLSGGEKRCRLIGIRQAKNGFVVEDLEKPASFVIDNDLTPFLRYIVASLRIRPWHLP
jgi:hypothetical protein